MPRLLTSLFAAAALLTGQQGTLRFLSDEPGTIRPYGYEALSAAELRRVGASTADARAFEALVKQVADVFRNSPVWNPPKGVDVLVSAQASVPSTVRKNQPLAAGLLVGSFEHLQIREADGTLGRKFVAGETTLVVVNVNMLPTAGSPIASLADDAGPFLKAPARTAEMGGFPVYGDLLVITAPGRQLWEPVSRERYLKAFVAKRRGEAAQAEIYIADQQKKLDAFLTPEATAARQAKYKAAVDKLASQGAAAMEHERRYWERDEADALAALKKGASRDPKISRQAATIAGLKAAEDDLAAMPLALRAEPACYVDASADPLKSGLVAAGTTGCAPVVAMNTAFFDARASRSAIQIVTVSAFSNLERNWKKGRPAAGTTDGSLDDWTTYEVLRTTDWKKIFGILEASRGI